MNHSVQDPACLTPRQREILAFIEGEVRDRGRPPTVREIGTASRINSPNGVCCHLKALRGKGFIDWEDGKNRSIRVIGMRQAAPVRVPSDAATGNVVVAGDLRVFESGKLEHYGLCLLVQFETEEDVRKAIMDKAVTFTMFAGG